MSHTPGPWIISHEDEALFSDSTLKSVRIAHHEGGAIADAYINCLVNTDEACRSNALLMAAAPDLLKALARLTELAEKFSVSGVYFDEFSVNDDAILDAHDAITKATGGAA